MALEFCGVAELDSISRDECAETERVIVGDA